MSRHHPTRRSTRSLLTFMYCFRISEVSINLHGKPQLRTVTFPLPLQEFALTRTDGKKSKSKEIKDRGGDEPERAKLGTRHIDPLRKWSESKPTQSKQCRQQSRVGRRDFYYFWCQSASDDTRCRRGRRASALQGHMRGTRGVLYKLEITYPGEAGRRKGGESKDEACRPDRWCFALTPRKKAMNNNLQSTEREGWDSAGRCSGADNASTKNNPPADDYRGGHFRHFGMTTRLLHRRGIKKSSRYILAGSHPPSARA